jgi:hypothetical protein
VYGQEIVDLFRAVKSAFDPDGILNPGVKLAGVPGRESREGASPISRLKVGTGAVPLPDDIATTLREIERTGSWDTDRLTIVDGPPARRPVSPP